MSNLLGFVVLSGALIIGSHGQPASKRQYNSTSVGPYNSTTTPGPIVNATAPSSNSSSNSTSTGAANTTSTALAPAYTPFNVSAVCIPPPPVVQMATCTNLTIQVTISSNNTNITAVQLPTSNREVTAVIVEYLTSGSNLSTAYGNETYLLNATYSIGATLCIPTTSSSSSSNSTNSTGTSAPQVGGGDNSTSYTNSTLFSIPGLNSTSNSTSSASNGTASASNSTSSSNSTSGGPVIQFLQHGIGFDRSYWDFALNTIDGTSPNNASYVQVANAAGYATLAIDRLGCGVSDHPDPIQAIQTQTFIEITKVINAMLKAGEIGNQTFGKVVNVGHSYGSIIAAGLMAQYPNSSDGSVLTGFTFSGASVPATFASWNLAMAKTVAIAPTVQNISANVSAGYWSTTDIGNNEFSFFKYPYFNESVLELAEATKQPLGIGTVFTLSAGVVPAPNFTGPVFAVTGENDFIFCGGNCTYNNTLADVVKGYPMSSNASYYSIPNTGHAANLHFSAPDTFARIQDWFKQNGF